MLDIKRFQNNSLPATGNTFYKDKYGVIYITSWFTTLDDKLDVTTTTCQPIVWDDRDTKIKNPVRNGALWRLGTVTIERCILAAHPSGYEIIADGFTQYITEYQDTFPCGTPPNFGFGYRLDSIAVDCLELEVNMTHIPATTTPPPVTTTTTTTAAPPPVLTLSMDTFTDLNGQDLTNHIPDIGPHWIEDGGPGSYSIQSNMVQMGHFLDTTITGTFLTMDVGYAQVTIDVDAISAAHVGSYIGVCFHFIDSSNFYIAYYSYGDRAFELYEVTGAGWALVASSALGAVAGNYHIKVVIQGSTVDAFLTGPQSATLHYDMVYCLTATRYGLYFGLPTLDLYDNWKVTAPIPTILSKDTFTAPDGTDLSVHTPDVGSSWTLYGGDFEIQSGQVMSISGRLMLTDVGAADATLNIDATVGSDTADSFIGCCFRMADDSHGYTAAYYYGDGAFELYELGDNGWAMAASVALDFVVGTYHIKVIVIGNCVTAVLSGAQSASLFFQMSDYLDATKCGIYFNFPFDDTFDNWQVTTP